MERITPPERRTIPIFLPDVPPSEPVRPWTCCYASSTRNGASEELRAWTQTWTDPWTPLVPDTAMNRTANPIEAILDSVEPYVITGEAAAALARWKRAEPGLAWITSFADLQANLVRAAGSDEWSPVLEAMLRRYEVGDNLACLVLLHAFVRPLYWEAIGLRLQTRHSLELCATAVLEGFLKAVYDREDRAVAGSLLVARARCDAIGTIELWDPSAPPRGTDCFPRLTWLAEEVRAAWGLVSDLVGVVVRELARARREKTARADPWRVVAGELRHNGWPWTAAGHPILDRGGPFGTSSVCAGGDEAGNREA
jgi:hypothetical protein